MPKKMTNKDRLLGLIERVEQLELERLALSEDIKGIFGEAKAAGFDVKVMRAIIRERAISEDRREEWQALLDIYRAALGMLSGTELGAAARKRLMKPPEEPKPPPDGEKGDAVPSPSHAADAAPKPSDLPLFPTATPEQIIAARAAGGAPANAGTKIGENPHVAGDPCRGAWDEGWCAASSSDGMDIPDAWRRTKPKPDKASSAASSP
jgi:uncharacterized protein (UPF0335 family)